jgi:hypothetical protein
MRGIQRLSRFRLLMPAMAGSILIGSTGAAWTGDALDAGDPFKIEEFRIGVLAHDAEDSNGEEGADLNFEIVTSRVGWATGRRLLDHFFMPRLHLGASLNFEGETSQAYAGFTWQTQITDRVFFESSFGASVHDGEIGDDAGTSFGCTVNFRESASLGVDLSGEWRMMVTFDHMSNAGLCGQNDGLTNAGVRFGYKW